MNSDSRALPAHLILSRKGFDSTAGGCPSPIFPDRSMLSLPIPDKRSPVRYDSLAPWRNRDVGELVETLTRGAKKRHFGAHLDPDLRAGARTRAAGWRPALGQVGAAQGHLRNQDVGLGDLFLFWGLFREVDEQLGWVGPPRHVIWGWLRVGAVVNVDGELRPAPASTREKVTGWHWCADHPHLAFPPDSSNTLYVAADTLGLDGCEHLSGAGVFETFSASRQLTVADARSPTRWSLPALFAPDGRPALSYHDAPNRWRRSGEHVLLDAASRGQEFVLDLHRYPGALEWAAGLFENR